MRYRLLVLVLLAMTVPACSWLTGRPPETAVVSQNPGAVESRSPAIPPETGRQEPQALPVPAEPPERPQGDVVGGVVAVVNGAIITREQVMVQVRPGIEKIEASKELNEAGKTAQIRQLVNLTLKTMIERELVLQEARRVMPAEQTDAVEADVDTIVKRAIREVGTLTRLEGMLQSEGRTVAKEKEYAVENRMIQSLLSREVDARVMVSPTEMQHYYREHDSEFAEPKRVRIRQIFLSQASYGSGEAALAKARDLKKQIDAGADFAKLATEYSDGPYAKEGGIWDFLAQGSGKLRPAVEKVAFELGIKQVGEPVETEIGVHLVRIEDVKPARKPPFTEVQNDIAATLQERKREKLYQDFIKRLLDKSYVQIRWE